MAADPQSSLRKLYDGMQNFAKWFFDVLKNFIFLDAILFVYEKTGSISLWIIYWAGNAVLALYITSYLSVWTVDQFVISRVYDRSMNIAKIISFITAQIGVGWMLSYVATRLNVSILRGGL